MTFRSLTRAALSTALFALSAPSVVQAQLQEARTETLIASDGTAFEATSAFVRVPELRLDRARPGTIDLAVVRVRRAGSTSRRAHLVLAGGPGDSGVNLALGIARQGGAALADLFDGDLIGVDQRGTGRSRPNLASPALYKLPLDREGSPELWLPIIERTAQEVANDFRSRGIRLEAYNTRESADDLEDVRKAFGHEKVTLWGRSYGSHLALATLARHPAIVERMILVGPEGPDHTWKLPSQVDAAILRISERAGTPELPARIRGVLDRLEEEPVLVELQHPMTRQPASIMLGAFDVQWIAAQALADARALVTLPAAFREMASGDFRRVAQIALLRRERLGVENAMKHVMDLSSGASAARRQRIDREASSALLGGAINFPGMHLQRAWNAADLGEDFRRPVSSDVPTLIVAGDLDPRTPVVNGKEIAATLRNSRLLVLENATHQFDFFGSPPILARLRAFLRGEPVDPSPVVLPPLSFER